MVNFCTKCGARLDVNTGACPNCTKEIPPGIEEKVSGNRSVQREASANVHSDKNSPTTQKKRSKHTAIKITVSVLAVIIFLAAGFGVLYYKGVVDIPLLSASQNETEAPAAGQDEKSIQEIFESYAENYQVMADNQDGTKQIKVSAPDFAGITKRLCEEKQIKKIDAKTLQDAIQEYPDLKKDYIFTAQPGEEQITAAFLDRVVYELMLSAMEQVEINQ